MAQAPHADEERRPSPDALLDLAEKEARGRLKVFLGMAPGVGKTYAMLSAARALKADGIDVVVGVVETHGRQETAALLAGLEILPRKPVTYRNRILMELDVEAAIVRRPKVMLVDELAHTNAAGLLHVKRYQDVEELLRHGIDVWTTLNIQHLESLTDVVQRIAGIVVRETVPDAVIEKADEIVVVDLPPEDLIQRLKEGKVYLPESARQAMDKFFKPSNLTALRELALRRTADRVDEQMLAQLRQQGIEGPWPTVERILVCVGGDEMSESVIKTAGRMAAAQKAEWTALHVKRSDNERDDRASLRRTEKAMRLAERLGATTVRLNARDLAGEILAYAKRNNITQVVVGRSKTGILAEFLGRSLSNELLKRARATSVLVVTPEGRMEPRRRPLPARPDAPAVARALFAASCAVAGAVGLGLALETVTKLPNLSMVFLLAVIVCAMRFGLWPAILASLLSFLAYNFFFIDPRWTFTVAEPHELLSLLIFLIVAVTTGTMAGRQREQAISIAERAEATQALFDFSRKLSGAPKIEDVIWLLASQAAATARGRSIVLLAETGGLAIRGGWPPEDELQTSDWTAARWAYEKGEAAGRGTGTLPLSRFQFRPMLGSKRALGVIGIDFGEGGEDSLPQSADAALRSFVEQAAIALERTLLVDQAAKAETAAESERLRSALLSSLSHDLRTPLSSIIGSVTALRTLGDQMQPTERGDLLATIEEEATRLARFVSNLLDMTRLEAGAIDLCHESIDPADGIRGAAARIRKTFPGRRLEVEIEDGLPLVRGDAALFEQVVFNLLDNAMKYSEPASLSRVMARATGRELVITVSDEGSGIPNEALEKVFEKFFRVAGSDGRAPGTGLGLSIASRVIAAMGGTIKAESPIIGDRGTRMTIRLPLSHDGERPT